MNSLLFKIKKNFLASLVLLIIVVSCGLAAYFFHPASPYFKRYTFVVKYETIGTLSPGNLVRVRGIAKGEIVSVELTDEAVYVRARVLAGWLPKAIRSGASTTKVLLEYQRTCLQSSRTLTI